VSIARLIILLFPLVVVAGLSGQAGWPLVVTSNPPGAVVYLDGAPVGLTPVTIDRVTAGSHRLRLTRDGHLENLKVIAADAPSEHHVTLTPLPLRSRQAHSPGKQAEATPADGENWFTKRKWLWIGAGAGGVAAAVFLTRPSEPVTGGSVLVSPTIGLQAATPITFASQGAGGGSSGTLTYAWDFGDGTTGSGPLVTHVYGTSGLFTVKVDVSDGKKSATATGSVTIRSLAGTWRGTLAGALGVTMTLTQNGAAVTGMYTDQAGSGTLTGSARAASPRVNLVISPSGFPAASYAADPNADVSRLTGVYRQQGLTIDLSLTKD
jgi:hypothetical protein